MEGFFARLFRSGVHPVEIGKRLLRVMEDGRTVALRRTYVPERLSDNHRSSGLRTARATRGEAGRGARDLRRRSGAATPMGVTGFASSVLRHRRKARSRRVPHTSGGRCASRRRTRAGTGQGARAPQGGRAGAGSQRTADPRLVVRRSADQDLAHRQTNQDRPPVRQRLGRGRPRHFPASCRGDQRERDVHSSGPRVDQRHVCQRVRCARARAPRRGPDLTGVDRRGVSTRLIIK